MIEIRKPGRYINGEWNAVHKEWKEGMLKIALCFPDIYEIGMSHLGLKIIYGLLNSQKDVVCERVFAPWSDMEAAIKAERYELLSLESKRRLRDFDIIGFSLQYEMNYTDVLNILDMGGISVRTENRGERDPLVLAGGPCALNPEPMADFIDAFVLGEAEEVLLEIVRVVRGLKSKVKGLREKLITEIAKINGVYVPVSNNAQRDLRVKRRIIKDLDRCYFPLNPVVPYIQVVHDRIGIEIMRGCPHRCKFCQACKIFGPLRLRSVERIMEIAEASIKSTGYERISLLSLSTGDYPYLDRLIYKMDNKFRKLGVKISLPSLWARHFETLPGIVKNSSFTFAPETGTDRLRVSLGKIMANDQLIRRVKLALTSGARKVKLYFMIGLPGETYEDLDGIVKLALQMRKVNLSISPFIPKPHSDFEREGMDSLEILREKKGYLLARLKARDVRWRIKVDFHNPEMSRIEALLSRGDRKMGEIIYKAWKKGARLQAWDEFFDYRLWEMSFDECGLEPEVYLVRRDGVDSLPWGFII